MKKKSRRKPSDKEMLDWLQKNRESLKHISLSSGWYVNGDPDVFTIRKTARQAIYAAMKAEKEGGKNGNV